MTPARPPLAGLTVLVPRARDQASDFSALLRARGAEPLEVPTIEIRPVASTTELDRAVADLAAGRFDWVVLTSVNGVAAVRARAEALGHGPGVLGHGPGVLGQDPEVLGQGPEVFGQGHEAFGQGPEALGQGPEALGQGPDARATARVAADGPATGSALTGTRVAAVGPATEAALRDWGIVPDLVPQVATTAALGESFPAGRGRVLLARADLANPELGRLLRDKGWTPTEVVAYHTVPVRSLDPAARRRLDGGEVDWVAFTASSTVEGFLRGYGGPPPPGVQVAAIGPVTAGTARAAGIRVAATATDHTIPGLVAAIEHAVGR